MTNHDLGMKHRILIVDDNRAIHADFDSILNPQIRADESDIEMLNLELFGEDTSPATQRSIFSLEHALSGKSALEKVKQAINDNQPFSVAFVDMRMPPGWDGLETIERIWQVDPYIQIVICTAYADHSLDEITDRLGITDNLFFVKKPFDNVEVAQLANALTVKWELAKMMEFNMLQMEQTLQEQQHEIQAAQSQKRPSDKPKN